MRPGGGEIFLGDLVRAIAVADASDPQMPSTIAQLLGFRLEELEVAVQQDEPLPIDVTEFTLPIPPAEQDVSQDAKEVRPAPPIELPPQDFQYELTEPDVEHIPPAKQSGLPTAVAWPEWEHVSSVSLRYQPLFLRQWTRGLLSEAAATWREAGPVDVPRALEVLALGRTPAELPRIYAQTLARGCQVLIDVSAGMAPFAKDCWQLIDALRAVVGREQVQVFYFKDCPIYGVEAEADARFVPFQSPPPTTPVLLLSDLGIATPAFSFRRGTTHDWLRLANRLREAACPLLALVPYPRRRWPKRLSKTLTIVQWDRVTTAASVRRAKETL